MKALGLYIRADLRDRTEAFLTQQFGKAVSHFHKIPRGIDERPGVADRPRKSAGSKKTYQRDLDAGEEIEAALTTLVGDVWSWAERSGIGGRTVTLKLRYADFEQITRSRTLQHHVASKSDLAEVTSELAATVFPFHKASRLLGVSMSNFETATDRTGPQMMFAF